MSSYANDNLESRGTRIKKTRRLLHYRRFSTSYSNIFPGYGKL